MNDLNNTNAHGHANVPEDDPRLTAYALGELEGDDLAAIERQLAATPSLRREVEAIRAAASMLRDGYAAEPVATLTESQRRTIMHRSESGALREALRLAGEATPSASSSRERSSLNSPAIFRARSRWVAMGMAAAAMLALAVTAALMLQPDRVADRVAIDDASPRSQLRDRDESQPAGDVRQTEALHQGIDHLAEPRVETLPPAMAEPAPKDASESETKVTRSLRAQRADANARTRAAPMRGAAGSAPPDPAGAGERSEAVSPSGQVAPATAGAAPPPTGPAAAPAAEPALPLALDGVEIARERLERDGAAVADTLAFIEAVETLSEKQIASMDESQLRYSLHTAEALRQSALGDAEQAERLKQQIVRLSERLGQLDVGAMQNAEEFARIVDNPFIEPRGEQALSTFAADVDTASYSNIRRMIAGENRLPPPDAVRIEEMLNYFTDYAYEPPSVEDTAPFRANVEIAPAPWNPQNRLVRIGLRGKQVKEQERPATSLVFLIDVSGSMNKPNKLPLVKDSLKLLVRQLHGDDLLGIVTYAGHVDVTLDPCYVNAGNRAKIEGAIDALQAAGSTNGGGGIKAAYDLARRHFIKGGINRVILCTDGDFNVGVSSDDDLVRLIEEQRKSNVFLSVLGYGAGNLKDGKMEKLANAGNGNFAYIDSIDEARKVLVQQMGGTLVTIAKDVKLQVQFNDERVAKYRLIGYEDRLLKAEDFANDRKDAGEIGSGHMVTALYEVEPVAGEPAPGAGLTADARTVHDHDDAARKEANKASELKDLPAAQLMELRIRYKEPEGEQSALLEIPVQDEGRTLESASADFRFAAAVAQFGMLLRDSPFKGEASYASTLDLAESGLGEDKDGYRKQFMDIVRKAQALAKDQAPSD